MTWALGAAVVSPLAGCGGGGHGPRAPGTAAPAGDEVDLVLPRLAREDDPEGAGDVLDFVKLRGRIVVVHFFATWSLAAQADVELLRALARERADDVEVVGVALDPPESIALVSPFVEVLQIGYSIALASEEVRTGGSVFGKVAAVPTTVLLDRQGRLRRWHAGPLSAGKLKQELDALR